MKNCKENNGKYKIKKLKLAFSLIEISVVILIIGILIAGISQGIDLFADYRFITAKNLTKNSRVGRIEDLEIWLETLPGFIKTRVCARLRSLLLQS